MDPADSLIATFQNTGQGWWNESAGSGIGENGDPTACCFPACSVNIGFRAAGQEGYRPSEVSPPLCNTDGGGTVPTIAFSQKDHGADACEDLAPTLRSMGHDQSHANGGGQIAVAFDTTQVTSKTNRSNPQPGDACHSLTSEGHAPAIAFTERGRDKGRTFESQEDIAYALCNPGSGGRTHSRQLFTPMMAVRRLTPLECTRLQGFKDDFFDHVLYRGKPPADGPIYKALGNSMAVPVIAWIGKRIAQVDAILFAGISQPFVETPQPTEEKETECGQ